MLTREKLMAAFQIFDNDNSGAITVDEIVQILGGGDSEEDLD